MSLRKKRNFKALQLPGKEEASDNGGPVAARPAPRRRPPPVYEDESAESKSAMHATITSTLANLDMNSKRLDLKDEDLTELHELGSGNGGSVMKVQHVSGTIMAKKVRALIPRVYWRSTTLADRVDRCKAVGSKANLARTSDPARMSLAIHHLRIRLLHQDAQPLHLHGILRTRLL